jgi:hypothetical protein
MFFDRDKFKEDLYQFYRYYIVSGKTYKEIARTYNIKESYIGDDTDNWLPDELGYQTVA